MKMRFIITLATLAAVALAPVAASADSKGKRDIGRQEYMGKCAVCHAQDGKGATSNVLDLLKKTPPDLTVLSKNNGGVFPVDRVYAVIDGRAAMAAHGSRDMPIWGRTYMTEGAAAGEYYVDAPHTMEMYARARILALIDYLNRLQAK